MGGEIYLSGGRSSLRRIRQLRPSSRLRHPEHLKPLVGAVEVEQATAHHARALHRRYCDWWQIDGELELDDSPRGSVGGTIGEGEPALDLAS